MKKNKKLKKTFKEIIKEVWKEEKSSVIRILSFGLFVVFLILFTTSLVNFVADLPSINIPFLVVAIISIIVVITSLTFGIYFEVSSNKRKK